MILVIAVHVFLEILGLQCVCGGMLSHADSLSFLVLGDWGGLPSFPYRTPIERAIADRLAKMAAVHNAQFIVALGDNFYFDGVTSVEDQRFQDTYNSVFLQTSCDLKWYLVAGNHDHNGNVSAQIDYSQREARWNFPHYYYNLSFPLPSTGDTLVDFVMIDTVLLCGNSDHDFLGKQPIGPDSPAEAEVQWAWIESQLQSSQAKYLIVAGHYPVYSVAEHGPTWCLVDRLMPMLHKYRVTSYMSGHDHNLQHLQTTTGGHKVDYFVSGAANFINPSLEHTADVPDGSSKFSWANIFSLGGLAYVHANVHNMTFTFTEANGRRLYNQTMYPRL